MRRTASTPLGGLLGGLLLAACQFHSQATSSDPERDAAVIDAPAPGADAGGADAADPGHSAFCDSIAGLVACYEFEDNTSDGSGNHLNAKVMHVTFAHDGKLGKALQFAADSSATVKGSPLFDVSALTIEAWIRPSQLPPSGTTAGILDVNNQYAFFLQSDGSLACDVHNISTIATSVKVIPGRWTHVACTYTSSVFRIYIDGGIAKDTNDNGTIASGSNDLSIASNNPAGSPLIGAIDQLRLLSVARSASQICADAERLACLSLSPAPAR